MTRRGFFFFADIPGVWIANETQNKNYEVNGEVIRQKSFLIKTGYANLLHSCEFLYFNLMNYILMSLSTPQEYMHLNK